ncbi:unnamed protein product, partial [Mesorhabditis belari]|uniref:Uncharacterized protein n=1 Tax=Mesorhabditis belari TaxID=2138241 RepID=A0AAF3J8T9_9BILA
MYILICVIATIIINCKHKNKGHHRYIHLFQEIGMIFLFMTMMALQFFLYTKSSPCKIVKILVDFFMVWVCAAFMFEAWFANSMINAASKKNGSIPAIINYIGSIVIALLSALIPYLLKQTEYTPSGLHCFAPTTGNTLWAFIIPPWLLITVACFKVQTAFLQCKKYDLKAVDRDQIYWAYRSARALPPFAWLLFGIYTTLMFGLDQQLYWVIILAIFMTFVYGPAIFFVHTYCHENTSKKWHPKFFGFYTPCPEEIRPPSPTPSDDISDSQPLPPDPQDPDQPPPEKPKKKKKNQSPAEKPKTPPPQGPIIPDKNHGGAQNFYDWLTDSKDTNKAQEESAMILFKPRP